MKYNKIANFLYIWFLSLIGYVIIVPIMSVLYTALDIDYFPTTLIIIQGVIVTGICSAIGNILSQRIGFNPPFISYLLNKEQSSFNIKKQLLYSSIIGIIGAIILFFGSSAFSLYMGQFPILNRIFGAGLYEEIIVRWFFASFFIWIFWRLFDRNSQKPGNIVIWSGLIISNILFIIGHYPAVSILISNNLEIINMFFWMFVITLPWGWLYWKFGIESAIIAHSVFHVIFILLQTI